MNSKPDQQIAVSIDIDWAPDIAIDYLAERLVEKGVKATWFVTHDSAAVQRLHKHTDLFELGIHPNFLPGSTHGKSVAEVLAHCLELVPKAISMRTHTLFQSTYLLAEVIQSTPIQFDSSILVNGAPNVQPFVFEWEGDRLVRVPYIWEDDVELSRKEPNWNLNAFMRPLHADGLKIFNFHPVTVYLNSVTIENYKMLKDISPQLNEASKEMMDNLVHKGDGVGTYLDELLSLIAETGVGRTIQEIGQQWI